MSWAFIAALFGVDAKSVTADAFGNARIWTEPGLLGAQVNGATGLVTGPMGNTIGQLREGVLGQLQLVDPAGLTIANARLDGGDVQHWVLPNEVEIGRSYVDGLGHGHDLTADNIQFATEYTSFDQLNIDWQSPGLEMQGFDSGIAGAGFDGPAFDAMAFDPGGIDLGAFSGFDPGCLDIGIDPGFLAGGFDASFLDGIDF